MSTQIKVPIEINKQYLCGCSGWNVFFYCELGRSTNRSFDSVYELFADGADLGLYDANRLKIKTGLVVEIRKAMRALDLTQQAAAKRMGISQPKVSGMMRGDFTNLSERKLMDCLNRLGYDIEIKVRPAAEPIGHLTLATA